MPQILVVSRECPGCKMPSHLPSAKFQELVQSRKKDERFSGLVLCDACNLISSGSTTIGPGHMYDRDNPPRGCLYEHLFFWPLQCAVQTCKTRAIVLAPKMKHYVNEDDLSPELPLWRVASDVRCPSGHPVPSPRDSMDKKLRHQEPGVVS
jgi:hypothetical protein